MKTPEKILRESCPANGMENAIAAFQRPHPPAAPTASTSRRLSAAAGLAMSVALGAAVVRLTATAAEAAPLAAIAQAERNASQCTAVMRDAEGHVVARGWQEGSRARFDMDPNASYGHTNAFDGRRTWFVDRSAGTALIVNGTIRQATPPFLQKVSDLEGERIRSSPSADGTLRVILERHVAYGDVDAERRTIVADRQNRPVAIEYATHNAKGWAVRSRETRDYDAPIALETFAFRVPKGFEAYDIDANRDRLREGARSGPSQTLKGVSIRLLGVLQERSGRLTVVYTGGTAPMPDAAALAERDGRGYEGKALVGSSSPMLKAGAARPDGAPRRAPASSTGFVTVEADAAPYATLDGQPLRVVRFDLPKLLGNPARSLRLTLPVVDAGSLRTVRQGVWKVSGRGRSLGTVTFANVVPIRSHMAEEVERLPDAKKSAFEIALRRP